MSACWALHNLYQSPSVPFPPFLSTQHLLVNFNLLHSTYTLDLGPNPHSYPYTTLSCLTNPTMQSYSPAPSPLGKRQRDRSESADGLFACSRKASKHDTPMSYDAPNNIKQETPDDLSQDQLFDESDDEEEIEEEDEVPNHPMHDPEIPRIQDACVDKIEEVRAVIDDYGCDTETVRDFRSKASELSVTPAPKPIIIGAVGASGDGKSERVNISKGSTNDLQAKAPRLTRCGILAILGKR